MPSANGDRWRGLIAARARTEGRDLPLDVVEELASHLADEEAAARERGLSEVDARATVLQMLSASSFLDVSAPPRARHRPFRGGPGVWTDVRVAIRRLRQSPGFTATAILTLAIGIGLNTAVFTLAHAVLLKSLPVAHASRLYKLGDQYRCCPTETLQGNWSIFPYPFYLEVRDRSNAFEEVAAADTLRWNLSVRRPGGSNAAEAFTGEFVSGNYFATLGVEAYVGRIFDRTDDRADAPPVAVVSYAAWLKAGLDRSAIGQPLTISGATVMLVGVAPPGFFGDRLEAHPPDFWLPLSLEPTLRRESTLLESRSAGWLYILGRLRPGRKPSEVQAQLETLLRNYLRVPGSVSHDDDRSSADSQTLRLVPGGSGNNAVKGDYEQGLLLLLAVSAAVLLIACANLANLLLVRSVAQRTAIAVELAMGASRWRIVRQQLTEAAILSLAGGAAGLLCATVVGRAVLLLAFRGAPDVPIATAPSAAVFMFALASSLATGALFGAVPAWVAARSDPADALRGSARVLGDAALSQRVLVVLQSAGSVVLITVAGLLSQSLRNVDRTPYGFEQESRLVVDVDSQSAGYTQPELDALYLRLDDRLSRVRGVIAESLSLYTAQQDAGVWGARIYLEGAKGPFRAWWDRVGPRYFETIGTPIVRGRSLDDHDTARSRLVAVVNEAFVTRYWPGQDPIGRHFGKYDPGHANDFEIVGVAKDARYVDAAQPVPPMFFVPLAQRVMYEDALLNTIEESSRYIGSIELHVYGDPDAVAGAVRTALGDVDPNLAPKRMTSLRELVRISTRQRVLTARLSEAFGVIALALAAIGLYGVTAYRVTRRTGEIGMRIALGAARREIVSLILRGACSQVAVGLLVGVPLAIVAGRALRTQLFGVSAGDVWILAASAAVVGGCGVIASIVPALRASSIAPSEALRHN